MERRDKRCPNLLRPVRLPPARGLLNGGTRLSGVRVEVDLAEGVLVLGDVLLEYAKQGLGLLGTQVDSLKVANLDALGRGLVHRAEHQHEVPDVDADLNAVGIGFAVVVALNEIEPAEDLWILRRT